MSLYSSVGVATGDDSYKVGVNAAKEALQDLDVDHADLAIIFASPVYIGEEFIKGVRSIVGPKTLLVGSSTAGEISQHGPEINPSIVVMLIQSDDIQFFAGISENIDTIGSRKAGEEVAKSVRTQAEQAGTNLKSFLMFPDVLVGNGADIVRGVLDDLGDHFPVVGGASGDDQKFVETFQYFENKVYSKSVVGLGMSGDFHFGVGVRHGWIPIGTSMKVIKSDGSLIQEINGKPAINVYEDHFGKERSEVLKNTENVASTRSVLTYPFGIVTADSKKETLIRFATDVLEDGSIRCAAEIPEGSDIRLMIGSKEEAIAAARDAAEKSLIGLDGNTPKAVIIFNCIARKNLFGEGARKEIDAIQDVLGANVPLAGFYTYGEQAPINGVTQNMKKCDTTFHNETVVIFTLG